MGLLLDGLEKKWRSRDRGKVPNSLNIQGYWPSPNPIHSGMPPKAALGDRHRETANDTKEAQAGARRAAARLDTGRARLDFRLLAIRAARFASDWV